MKLGLDEEEWVPPCTAKPPVVRVGEVDRVARPEEDREGSMGVTLPVAHSVGVEGAEGVAPEVKVPTPLARAPTPGRDMEASTVTV